MQVLISPADVDEAVLAHRAGASIIDVKNPAEGSLGAGFPWLIRQVVERCSEGGTVISATLGDLPHKPGSAALAALGAAVSGARYVKAGLHGSRTAGQATELMQAVVRACREHAKDITVVAAGYADYRRFEGLAPLDLVEAAALAHADLVMLDTFSKDGQSLFDALTDAELASFASAARRAGLRVALAGSLRAEHLGRLAALGADVIGVRGAVCAGGDRGARIDPDRAAAFMDAARAYPSISSS